MNGKHLVIGAFAIFISASECVQSSELNEHNYIIVPTRKECQNGDL